MGGGGDGGMSDEQKYYQDQQLALQKESLEISKQSLEDSKSSVTEAPKSVISNIKGSTAASEQAAALRRGIASTFNRQVAFAPAGSGSATSGGSTKLGN